MDIREFADVPIRLAPTMIHLAIGTSVILVTAFVLSLALVRSSAAVRHRTWSLSVAAVLLLPIFILSTPQWHLSWIAATPSSEPVSEALAVSSAAGTQRSSPPLPLDAGTFHGESAALAVEQAQSAIGAADQNSDALWQPITQADSAPAAGSVQPVFDPREKVVPEQAVPTASLIGQPLLWLVIWSTGALLALLPLLRSMFVMRGICARASQSDDSTSADLVAALTQQMAIRRQPLVLQSSDIDSPLCVGWCRPLVLLPVGWQLWPRDHLRAALAHELAHILRGDVTWQLLARLACALYWVNPLIWLAAWRMRVERELACDDRVLEIGEQPTRYARLLLHLATKVACRGRTPTGVAVAMASAAPVEQRIRAILRPDLCRRPVSRVTGMLLALIIFVVMVLMSIASPSGSSGGLTLAGEGEDPPVGLAEENSPTRQRTDQYAADTTNRSTGDVERNEAPAQTAKTTWQISGRVLDEQQQPIAGASVEAISFGDFNLTTRTASDGTFALLIPVTRKYDVLVQVQQRDARLQAAQLVPSPRPSGGSPVDVTLQLRPDRELIATVLDSSGAAVNDATVAVAVGGVGTVVQAKTNASGGALLRVPMDLPLRYILAVKADFGLDYFSFWGEGEPISDPYRLPQDHNQPITMVLDAEDALKVRVRDDKTGLPLSGATVSPSSLQKPKKGTALWITTGMPGLNRKTDKQGLAALPFITDGSNHRFGLSVGLAGYGSKFLYPDTTQREITVRLEPTVSVTGRVQNADGAPAANARVRAVGNSHLDRFNGIVQTGPDGGFEVQLPPSQFYSFVAEGERLASKIHTQWIPGDDQANAIQLTLTPATRIFGRVTIGPESRPAANQYVSLTQHNSRPFPRKIRYGARTDDQGRYEFHAAPGSFTVAVPVIAASKWMYLDDAPVEVNFSGDTTGTIRTTGRVISPGAAQPGIAEAVVTGIPRQRPGLLDAVSNHAGQFVVDRKRVEMVIHAATPDGRLAGVVEIGPDDSEIVVPVGPTGEARGRLVDATTGEPRAGQQIQYGANIHEQDSWKYIPLLGGEVTTGDDGGFSLSGLTTGIEYALWALVDPVDKDSPRSPQHVGTIQVERPMMMELGHLPMTSSMTR